MVIHHSILPLPGHLASVKVSPSSPVDCSPFPSLSSPFHPTRQQRRHIDNRFASTRPIARTSCPIPLAGPSHSLQNNCTTINKTISIFNSAPSPPQFSRNDRKATIDQAIDESSNNARHTPNSSNASASTPLPRILGWTRIRFHFLFAPRKSSACAFPLKEARREILRLRFFTSF